MSDHHNQYHRPQHRHHQQQQQQQHPYSVGMHHSHSVSHSQQPDQQQQQQHPQHYRMGQPQQQGLHPLPPHNNNSNNNPGLHHHPIPSSSSSTSATEESRGRSNQNKRPAASLSSSSSNAAASSPASSSIAVDVVAQTPTSASLSSSSSGEANTTPSSAAPRSTKKAKKSSPRSSPTGDGESVKSTGTTSAARGLRHFSMMVCQKVEEKGTTTYNEVADELVKKVVAERQKENPNGSYDQKNIRRRVYDALNVLMAMDIISKQKKEITWKGLPTAAKQDMDSMRKEIEYRQNQIDQKKEALKDVLTQQVCFRNLVHRNQQREQQKSSSSTSSSSLQQQSSQSRSKMGGMPDEKIPLPFIVVNTNQSAVIQCDMSRDRTNVMFDFSLPFEINDDNTILKKMHMDRTSMSTLRQMLPEGLLHYCVSNRLADAVLGREDPNDEQQPQQSQQHLRLMEQPRHEEVGAPPLSHHHPSDLRRGNISIGGSGSRHGRIALHDHHQPPPTAQQHPHHLGHHSYDHHPHPGSRGAGSHRRSGHPHQHPPPGVIPSSVSSSRRGIRDPYSY